jgi:hypothetical protein
MERHNQDENQLAPALPESMLRSQEYAGTRGITLAFENHWKDYYSVLSRLTAQRRPCYASW